MELFPDVPTGVGPRPVWLAHLESAADWRGLLDDRDGDRLIDRERRPFGLFTVSPDPEREQAAWAELADYCVERELMLVASWGANSTVLDDIFDWAALGRQLDEFPGSEPLTSWHDDEPVEDALEFFLDSPGSDLRQGNGIGTDWVRVVLVVRDRGWFETLRGALSSATRTG